MLHTISSLPLSFWYALLVFLISYIYAVNRVKRGSGLPLLAVLTTVFFWYVGDVLYNDYDSSFARVFPERILSIGWYQVALFTFSLVAFDFSLFSYERSGTSLAYTVYSKGVSSIQLQASLSIFFRLNILLWMILLLIAFINVGSETLYFILPILGERVDPFARPRIGGGFSAFLSVGIYLYILVGAIFGLIAALSKNAGMRIFSLVAFIFIALFFLLGRTRNSMLAVLLPGLLGYIFLRVRGSAVFKVVLIIASFVVVNAWFRFVMDSRLAGTTAYEYLNSSSMSSITDAKSRHLGLNMYEELCWINGLMETGRYRPEIGRRYFAELVNPIPRAIWPGKPTIGIDYAIARGQRYSSSSDAVTATISTGVVGQGVVNFGALFGPIFAAFIMSLWVGLLRKMDTSQNATRRLPLYILGLILTFNLGRDITLLVLYPFFFGWIALKIFERYKIRLG